MTVNVHASVLNELLVQQILACVLRRALALRT